MRIGLHGLAIAGVLLASGCSRSIVPTSQSPVIPHSMTPVSRKLVPVQKLDRDLEGVCHLKVNRSVGPLLKQIGSATGALVEGRYVITAAHNIVDASYPLGKVESLEVVAGRIQAEGAAESVSAKGSRKLAEKFRWRPKTFSDPQGSSYMIQHDYGFVDLGEKINRGGVFELGGALDLEVGDAIKVAGYPEGGSRLPLADGKRLFRASGRITEVTGNLFSYDVVTARGMSGAPVWIEKGGRRILVGIHVGSDFEGHRGAVARRVERAFLREWKVWRAANRS